MEYFVNRRYSFSAKKHKTVAHRKFAKQGFYLVGHDMVKCFRCNELFTLNEAEKDPQQLAYHFNICFDETGIPSLPDEQVSLSSRFEAKAMAFGLMAASCKYVLNLQEPEQCTREETVIFIKKVLEFELEGEVGMFSTATTYERNILKYLLDALLRTDEIINTMDDDECLSCGDTAVFECRNCEFTRLCISCSWSENEPPCSECESMMTLILPSED